MSDQAETFRGHLSELWDRYEAMVHELLEVRHFPYIIYELRP